MVEIRIVFDTKGEPCLGEAEKARLMAGVTEYLPDRLMEGFRLRELTIGDAK